MKLKKISILLFTLTCSFTSISNTPISGAQILSENQGRSELKNSEWLEAAKKGNLKKAKELENEINIRAKNKDGMNALHLACLFSGNIPMIEWLLDKENGCNIDIESTGFAKKTPFLYAAQGGDVTIATLLKEKGANIHAEDNYGKNALQYACLYSGSKEMVTWLLDECEIDIESKGYAAEKTPFLSAAYSGQLAIAKELKARGANINASIEGGNNALHLACLFSKNVEMVDWLLDECKIGLESKGYNQQTPFLCAAQGGDVAIANALEKRDANIQAKDKYGRNALHYATTLNKEDMVKYLQTLKINKP